MAMVDHIVMALMLGAKVKDAHRRGPGKDLNMEKSNEAISNSLIEPDNSANVRLLMIGALSMSSDVTMVRFATIGNVRGVQLRIVFKRNMDVAKSTK